MAYKKCDFNMDVMKINTDRENIIKQIEESRQDLYTLISMTDDFGDEEVIVQSQKLDELLNIYEQLKV